MKKTDVQTSYHQGFAHRHVPMVDVKVRMGMHDAALVKLAQKHQDEFDDPLFVPWLEQHADKLWNDAWESALEQGWERLSEDAEQVFEGYRIKVWSAGRSGGWCVVEGLPDLETWDAILLGKWARFCKWARADADDTPYLMVSYLYLNPFERYRERVNAKMAMAGRDAGIVEDR